MKAKIVVAGKGNMAQEMITVASADEGRQILQFEPGMTLPTHGGWIAVHFGSGKELDSLRGFCREEGGMPLIQGSTKDQPAITNPGFPVVNAPNLGLDVVRSLMTLPALVKAHKRPGAKIEVVESHQDTKVDPSGAPVVSGTARVMADAFGLDESSIVSIRVKVLQLIMGVPKEFLDGHGYHWVLINENIVLCTKVNGRKPYAEGALDMADYITQHCATLENRVHDVTEMLGLMSA